MLAHIMRWIKEVTDSDGTEPAKYGDDYKTTCRWYDRNLVDFKGWMNSPECPDSAAYDVALRALKQFEQSKAMLDCCKQRRAEGLALVDSEDFMACYDSAMHYFSLAPTCPSPFPSFLMQARYSKTVAVIECPVQFWAAITHAALQGGGFARWSPEEIEEQRLTFICDRTVKMSMNKEIFPNDEFVSFVKAADFTTYPLAVRDAIDKCVCAASLGKMRVQTSVPQPVKELDENAFEPPHHRIVEAFQTFNNGKCCIKFYKQYVKKGKTFDVKAQEVATIVKELAADIDAGQDIQITSRIKSLDAKLEKFASEGAKQKLNELVGNGVTVFMFFTFSIFSYFH
jgi:hypothetical protein